VVVHRDEAAADTALAHHRALAEECQAALQARVTEDIIEVRSGSLVALTRANQTGALKAVAGKPTGYSTRRG